MTDELHFNTRLYKVWVSSILNCIYYSHLLTAFIYDSSSQWKSICLLNCFSHFSDRDWEVIWKHFKANTVGKTTFVFCLETLHLVCSDANVPSTLTQAHKVHACFQIKYVRGPSHATLILMFKVKSKLLPSYIYYMTAKHKSVHRNFWKSISFLHLSTVRDYNRYSSDNLRVTSMWPLTCVCCAKAKGWAERRDCLTLMRQPPQKRWTSWGEKKVFQQSQTLFIGGWLRAHVKKNECAACEQHICAHKKVRRNRN